MFSDEKVGSTPTNEGTLHTLHRTLAPHLHTLALEFPLSLGRTFGGTNARGLMSGDLPCILLLHLTLSRVLLVTQATATEHHPMSWSSIRCCGASYTCTYTLVSMLFKLAAPSTGEEITAIDGAFLAMAFVSTPLQR